MRFLVDRCAGHRLALWLARQGHDVLESKDLGPDPGDRTLLAWAVSRDRVLVTMDSDFGDLIFRDEASHRGLIRLPDVPTTERIRLMGVVLARHADDLAATAIITVRGDRIRVSKG